LITKLSYSTIDQNIIKIDTNNDSTNNEVIFIHEKAKNFNKEIEKLINKNNTKISSTNEISNLSNVNNILKELIDRQKHVLSKADELIEKLNSNMNTMHINNNIN
jgi:hypothetical protein